MDQRWSTGRRAGLGAVALTLVLALAAPAAAPAQVLPPPAGGVVQPYKENDAGGFRNALPPGSNGFVSPADFAEYTNDPSKKPLHSSDQLKPYRDLVFGAPSVGGKIEDYFKDESFGVRPGDVDDKRSTSPCPGATVLRDKGYGVPRVYGSTRSAAMCALGYIAAEDRLFLIDVLRRAGRAELTSFIGGAKANREMDEKQWQIAPYPEEDLEQQVVQLDRYGDEGRQLQQDIRDYVAGINRRIAEVVNVNSSGQAAGVRDPSKLPVEYGAIHRLPEPWKETDLVATASLVGGIFGKGGGRELDAALLLQELQKRFEGSASRDYLGGRGRSVFDDFRRAEDPEAPTTVDKRFPYQAPPEDPDRDSSGIPDPDSVKKADVVLSECAAPDPKCSVDSNQGDKPPPPSFPEPTLPPGFPGLLNFPKGASNALLVSGSKTSSGRPQAVFGPQVGYFSPEILMEEEVHAPTLDARGAAFPGVNLYVQLGRGRDYAWSATSAGQDITDTYAVGLCQPGGGEPSKDSEFYEFRGECERMDELVRQNVFNTNVSDPTVGEETLRTQRTKLGLVIGRGTIDGKPVAYTQLRSTYRHEIDSARGFADFNDPDKIKDLDDYQKAASKIGYTFNWFYTDSKEIGYFNSGNNPVRPEGIDPDFPVRGEQRYEWRNYEPDDNTADYTPPEEHPQADDPKYLTSWNNKQAPGYRAADDNFTYGPVHRSEPLDDRIKRVLDGGRMKLNRLVDSMEDAATVDLRGDKVLPYALDVIGDPSELDGDAAKAVRKLRAWEDDGAHRRDLDKDGHYEHSKAIEIMDAWWPKLLEAEFKPALDDDSYKRLESMIAIDDPPNLHLGSSYLEGWYSYAEKDLRSVLEDGGRSARSREDGNGPPASEDVSGTDATGGDDPGANDGSAGADDPGARAKDEPEDRPEAEKDAKVEDRKVSADSFAGDPGDEDEQDTSVEDPYSRIYCGGDENDDGNLKRCRKALISSLDDALEDDQQAKYENDPICKRYENGDQERPKDDQVCFDAILFSPAGAIEQPLINWQNRPTFQQVVEVKSRSRRNRNRSGGSGGDGNGHDGKDSGSGPGEDGLSLLPCLSDPLPVRSLGIGGLRLGLDPVNTLLRAGLPATSAASVFGYCLNTGGKLLVGFSPSSKVRLVVSTGSGQKVRRGVHPGSSVTRLRAVYPGLERLGPGLYRATPSSRLVFGVRKGHVRYVAVADLRLAGDPKELGRYLDRLGL